MIREVKKEDKEWISEIFSQNEKILGGKQYFTLQWHLYWKCEKSNEFWIAIDKVAFCHYLIRKKDGVSVIYEIATHNDHKKKGYGKQIIKH